MKFLSDRAVLQQVDPGVEGTDLNCIVPEKFGQQLGQRTLQFRKQDLPRRAVIPALKIPEQPGQPEQFRFPHAPYSSLIPNRVMRVYKQYGTHILS